MNIILNDEIKALLQSHHRIAVTGPPRSGKSFFIDEARGHPPFMVKFDNAIYHTDDTMSLGWDAQPMHYMGLLEKNPLFIIEGIQVPRILRKGLEIDLLITFAAPKEIQNKGQAALWKGAINILTQWAVNDDRYQSKLIKHLSLP